MEVPQKEDPPFTVTVAPDPEPAVAEEQPIVQEDEDTEEENNGNDNGNNNGGQEEIVTDPAKGFLNRVRSRILQGLQTLTEPEE